jgi:hypothetical protein
VKPRRVTHHGFVEARGFWFSQRQLPLAELERRAIEHWQPGAELLASGNDYVVVLPRARRIAADQAPGAALVDLGGLLSSAPLSLRERQTVADAELLLVEGGEARTLPRSDLRAVDPATLLDVGCFELCDVRSLGELPATPVKVVPLQSGAEQYDMRTGRSAEQRAQAAAVVEALESASRDLATRRHPARASLLSRLLTWFARRAAKRPAAAVPPAATRALASPAAAGLFERVRALFSRWLARTRFMEFLARQQAEYLRELLLALRRHDDLEVLRRAIPLGGKADASSTPALTAPRPRTSFEIELATSGSGSGGSLGLSHDFYEELRRAYEAVFARLDAAGRHEDAAFFLAEILNESERAVSYLERHGRLELAAELAEARALPPGLVVRQWFIAGQRERAIAIAIREHAFDDAIARLERAGEHELAGALRMLQADRLAAAGRFVAAARLVHELARGRPLALRWLALAREGGELSGLPLELTLAPERFSVVHGALQPLLGPRGEDVFGPDERRQRLALADGFVRIDGGAGRSLAQRLAREVLVDAAQSGDRNLVNAVRELAERVGDAFRADFPGLVSFELTEPPRRKPLRYARSDCGTRPLFDAVRVGRRFAVALGEGGVALLDAGGRTVAHFDQPAYQLVAANDGLRLLAVAARGGALRVGRIDLATRRCDHWGDLRVEAFARSFDGQTWVVAEPDDQGRSKLLVVDCVEEAPAVLRRLPLPLRAIAVDWSSTHCNVVGAEPGQTPERLRYELPSFTLRERKPLMVEHPSQPAMFVGLWVATGNHVSVTLESWLLMETDERTPFRLRCGRFEIQLPADWPAREAPALTASEQWFATSVRGPKEVRLVLGSVTLQHPTLELTLKGARSVNVRLQGELALVTDDTGRLLVFNLASSHRLVDVRL